MAKGKKGKKKLKAIEREQESQKKADVEKSVEDQPAVAEISEPSDAILVSGEMPDEEMLYDLADLFKVFADTTRIKILYAILNKDMCVADIADMVGVSQSAVSHQLRSMKQAHLVKFRREGKQIIYSLSDDHVYAMLSQGLSHICE